MTISCHLQSNPRNIFKAQFKNETHQLHDTYTSLYNISKKTIIVENKLIKLGCHSVQKKT